MTQKLLIEVASDVVCPWCYIGKRRLEKALEALKADYDVQVEWLPFQLNPGMPEGGMARADYRRQKFGSVEKGKSLDARVAQEGAGEGINFAFDRMQRTPNTVAAHRLIDLAQRQGKGEAVVDALFRAYFEEARDIGDAEVLKSIADGAGVAGWPAQADAPEVSGKEERVRDLGISGVPTFIFNKQTGISGAYPPEMLVQAVKDAFPA
jgi:predicted DsbA family dithiol-disulfide isomerase